MNWPCNLDDLSDSATEETTSEEEQGLYDNSEASSDSGEEDEVDDSDEEDSVDQCEAELDDN